MPLVIADRVRETSTTTGTGTLTLDGAVTGFRTFGSAIGSGNTCYYTITLGADWEVGLGTVGTGTLARTTVLKSSNANSAVNFGAGTKDVFVTYTADRSVYKDASGNVNALGTISSGVWNGTEITVPYGGTGVATLTGIVKGNGQSAFSAAVAGTDYVTPTGSETLTNKTLGSGTLFSANVNGQDNNLLRVDLQDYGYVYFNSGTTNALDYTNGSHQRWTPNTGAQTLSITNFPPSGNLGELLIEGVNLGAATITWPTINWIKSDGTTTTTFSSNGVTLQSSGIDWVLLWTRDAGTTIYGKIVR